MNNAVTHNIALFLSGEEVADDSLLQYAHDGLFSGNNHFHLVHIVDEASLKSLPVNVDPNDEEAVRNFYDEKFSAFSEKMSQQCEKGLQMKRHILFHNQAKLHALHFLKEIKADSCVLATRGEQGVEGIFAESFSYYLVAHAPCDVLVVRPRDKK